LIAASYDNIILVNIARVWGDKEEPFLTKEAFDAYFLNNLSNASYVSK